MSSTIHIRPYQDQDAAATVTVFLRAIREVASQHYAPAQVEAWAQVDDAMAWAQHRLTRPAWVAECQGLVIGFCDLTASGCLDMLFVHPDYQRLGVAKRLFACAEDHARQLGLKRLYTEASLSARPFFEQQGFDMIAKQSVEKRGQYLTNFLMAKSLS